MPKMVGGGGGEGYKGAFGGVIACIIFVEVLFSILFAFFGVSLYVKKDLKYSLTMKF